MGTNYYLKNQPSCGHCGSPSRHWASGLHIGKSSAGWSFLLRIYPATIGLPDPTSDAEIERPRILTLDAWLPLFEQYGVVDNSGREIGFADMLDTITKRSHPNGLLRHTMPNGADHPVCMEGVTYDLIPWEFESCLSG